MQAIPDHAAIVPAGNTSTHATGRVEISDSEEATVQARVVLSVVGAQDQSLQDLVEGDYSRQWTHHRRDVFKRLETDKDKENGQSSSNSMFLYFWDDIIDGEAADRGWWFGPEVGGENVVLRKKSNAKFPPADNWTVLSSGIVSETLKVNRVGDPEVVDDTDDEAVVAHEAARRHWLARTATAPPRQPEVQMTPWRLNQQVATLMAQVNVRIA